MNKNNNKKVGLRSARMRQLARAGAGGAVADDYLVSLQALTVTVDSLKTLTLTANIFSDSSGYNSHLFYETADKNSGGICSRYERYFYLNTTGIMTQNQNNIKTIKTIIIENDDFLINLDVNYLGVVYYYDNYEYEYYVSKVTIKNKNNNENNEVKVITNNDDNNLITENENIKTNKKYYKKESGSWDRCPYTELYFSLSIFNAL